MARDICAAFDSIERAKGASAALDAMVSLLMGCNPSDTPDNKSLAELLWSVRKELDTALNEAESRLKS